MPIQPKTSEILPKIGNGSSAEPTQILERVGNHRVAADRAEREARRPMRQPPARAAAERLARFFEALTTKEWSE